MKERPIIMTAESVRAILDGRKTQTRRVMKPQPAPIPAGRSDSKIIYTSGWFENEPPPRYIYAMCPYGVPGDRLWVRETFCYVGEVPGPEIVYKANIPDWSGGWSSPIHMPRWASRITLEITGVRVERVQDMNYHDLEAEGMTGDCNQAMNDYILLWDRLNAKRGYPWANNPWVWVVEFARVTP